MLILESEEHARARSAPVLATVAGYGAATDCHHLTQPQPQGNAALQSDAIGMPQTRGWNRAKSATSTRTARAHR